MKIRDSGMPEEDWWTSFFDVDTVLDRLGVRDLTGDIVDLGCGYGTFTVAAAARTSGMVHALDIEPAMVITTLEKVERLGLDDVSVRQCDVLADGTGLRAASCAYVMAFNILHGVEPEALLEEAWRILAPGGRLGIIHWNPDPTTPRGPDLAIRPRPEQCQNWLQEAGFFLVAPHLHLPPYHYGVVGRKA
jgi:ubiquinone/menaquinone biosynthesis C-methylase UbiE